jgi:hypothetical protein
MTTVQEKPVNNGVNVQALLDARTALSDAPEGAKFKWRATNEWQAGTHSQSIVEEFFGLGDDQKHRTTFTFSADHPEVFASEDHGATPVEFVLVGLASCLTAGVAAVAQNREIQLNSVKATIEGDMDILGILGGSATSGSTTRSTLTQPSRRSRPSWPSLRNGPPCSTS